MDLIKNFFENVIDVLIPLIPAIFTIILPISVYKIFIPLIFRPDVYGGIPWFEPSSLTLNIFYYSIMSMFVYILAVISCLMMSMKVCKKTSLSLSFKYATFVLTWFWFGIIMINTLFLPYGKAILLNVLKIPYSVYFVDGILLMPFVLMGTMLARSNNTYDLCSK